MVAPDHRRLLAWRFSAHRLEFVVAAHSGHRSRAVLRYRPLDRGICALDFYRFLLRRNFFTSLAGYWRFGSRIWSYGHHARDGIARSRRSSQPGGPLALWTMADF